MAENANPNNDAKSDTSPLGLSARFHVDPTTGEVENIELILSPTPSLSKESSLDDRKHIREMHEEMLHEILYYRNDQWILPNLVPRWQKLNGEHGILFTKEFESELVADIMDGEHLFDEKLSNDNGEDSDKTIEGEDDWDFLRC